MLDRRKRRRWSAAENLEICDQARVPGVLVAQVTRWYALSAATLHDWLKDMQFGKFMGLGRKCPIGTRPKQLRKICPIGKK